MGNNWHQIEPILSEVVTALDGEDTVAIGLTGSYARAEAGFYSDIDIYLFNRQPPKDSFERYHLEAVQGCLVSITKTTIEDKRSELNIPESAIWVVPGLRQMLALRDKTGELAALKQEADNFQWQALQSAADKFVSAELMGYAEEIYKVMGGNKGLGNQGRLYAMYGLALGMARMMLVQHGSLLESENRFFVQAQETMGFDSRWSNYFRIVAGTEKGNQARAALELYVESAKLLRAIIRPEHMAVINLTLKRIDEVLNLGEY